MINIKNQKFGMEIEFTGITRQEAAKALGEYFGERPIHTADGYDTWSAFDSQDRGWQVKRDGSIKAEKKAGQRYIRTDNEAYKCEFVTPVLTYEDIPHLQEAIRAIRNAGGKVNSSCGLHIHVDAANHNRQSLKKPHSNHVLQRGYAFQGSESQRGSCPAMVPEGSGAYAKKSKKAVR